MIICVCISVESKQKLYASLNIKNISVKDKFNVSTFENS